MKRLVALILALSLLLCGCGTLQSPKQYTATFLTLFDTVATVVGYARSEEEFTLQAQKIHDELQVYHRLFDIYNDYEGINNLKTVNDNAGIAPVQVDEALIRLLQDCKHYCTLTGKKVNAAMGGVLALWHRARSAGISDPQNAKLPSVSALEAAAAHTDFDAVVIDTESSTVYITDPELSLDVGAIAKGWATQRVAENAPEGLLISVGGNVCATGPKMGENPWVIGIQDPQGGENLHTVYVEQGCVVTSGDYQRTYTVDGKKYHHIIDPDTLMPSAYWSSVTIVCADSGMADALSTALFLLPLEEGQALAESCGADAFWVDAQGNEYMTSGFRSILRT